MIGLLALHCVAILGVGPALDQFTPERERPAEATSAPMATATAIRGAWLGAITVGAQSVRVGIIVEATEEGALTAIFRQIDPKVTQQVLPVVEFDGRELRFSLSKPNASYTGTLEGEPARLAGVWRQRGVDYPLVFERVDSLPGERRPQEPERPLPYHEEEVRIESAPGVVLTGTFTRPRDAGASPAVLLISGSGAQDRDESAFGHRPFLVLSDALTRRGFAVLRLDDRGVGGSTGDVYRATLRDLSDDVLAAVESLARRKDVDPSRIGLVGHSEGGLVATIAASKSNRIAHVALLATPLIPPRELRAMQSESIGRSLGASDAAIEAIQAFNREAFDAAAAGEAGQKLQQTLADAGRRMLAAIPESERQHYTALAQDLVATAVGYSTPWFRSLLHVDPGPTLNALRCPVLALFGGKDIQVSAEPNSRAAEASLHAEVRPRSTVVVLPSVNHMLQTARSGALSEYVLIDETVAPAVLDALHAWMEAR